MPCPTFVAPPPSDKVCFLRSFAFERYVIFYEPLVDGIALVRLLHSARDVDTQFGSAARSDE